MRKGRPDYRTPWRRALLILLVPCFWSSVYAATFYVAADGDDTHDGLSESAAWRTVEQVNSETGTDDVVLFRRGDVFRGQINVNGENMTFGAYGEGANPVISGSVPIVGWEPFSGSIYVATTTVTIHHLYVDDNLMTIARYPNTGWLRTDHREDPAEYSRSGFVDTQLVGHPRNAVGYWDGATIRIRSFSWIYDVRRVSHYDGNGGITLHEEVIWAIQDEWGYFLEGKLSELDAPGEWFQDPDTHQVYFYPRLGTDPNNSLIEGIAVDYGFNVFWQKHNTTIEGFTIHRQAKDGININQSNRVTVRDNHFDACVENGLHMAWNSANQVFEDNTFRNMLNGAIRWNSQWETSEPTQQFQVGDSRIHRNNIRNTALIPGYALSGSRGTAIEVFGSGVRITENVIEDSGFSGIFISRGGHTVERNVIRRSCLTLNDGGSIYIQSNGNRIASNFVSESVGNVESAGGYYGWMVWPIAMGIYFEGGYGSSVIEGNTTVGHTYHGIYVDLGADNRIRNNVCYDSTRAQIQFRGDGASVYNNTVEGNTLCCLHEDQICLGFLGMDDFGSFDRNYYYNAESDILFKQSDTDDNNARYYSLPHWRAEFPARDLNSRTSERHYTRFDVQSTSPNLIADPGFALGTTAWWSSGAAIPHDTNKPEMDGGCLRVERTEETASVSPNDLVLGEDQFYRLRFSAIGEGLGTLRVMFYDETASPDWRILEDKYFALDAERKEHSWIFQSPLDVAESRPWFNTGSEVDVYWLDNVTLEPVTVMPTDIKEDCRLVENKTGNTVSVDLGGARFFDLEGNLFQGQVVLDPFSSKVLLRAQATDAARSLIRLY